MRIQRQGSNGPSEDFEIVKPGSSEVMLQFNEFLALCLLAVHALSSSVGRGIAKSTYAATDPFAGASFMLKYFPVEEAKDDCYGAVCVCSNFGVVQQGRVALFAPDNNQSPMSLSFGIHLVNVTERVTTGGIAVDDVEAAFAERLGDMEAFDAFMDYNVGFLTENLTPYTRAFDADDVPYLVQWFEAEDGAIWYSATVLVPGSHMVVELFSTTYFGKNLRKATSPRLGNTTAYPQPPPPKLTAIRVSRATASLSAIDEFYQKFFRVYPLVETSNRHCFQLYPEDVTLVCYTEHADDLSDVLTVAQFEKGVSDVHAAHLLDQPLCGMDKWLDNHFAIDNPGSGDLGDHIVSLLDDDDDCCSSSRYYYYCQSPLSDPTDYSLHYLVDPTGWGIQLDINFSYKPEKCYLTEDDAPSTWSSVLHHHNQEEKRTGSSIDTTLSYSSKNPACNPGLCDARQ